MTAVTTIPVVEYATCLRCGGSGELPTGIREHETGILVGETCTICHGDGTVPAEHVSTCEVCTVQFWTGDGCEHGPAPLCLDCRVGCRECVDDALLEAAEAYAADERALAGGGWS